MINMNKIKTFFVLLVMVVCSVACTEEQPVVKYLDITPNNLAGTWELVEWNGSALVGDSYFRIEFIRKDCKFTIWQNFDSMGQMPHEVTGEYSINEKLSVGKYLSGMYDNGEGYWAHDYLVRNLTETSMTMVALDDETFVQKFVRVNPLP
jgi:hypothetical protein